MKVAVMHPAVIHCLIVTVITECNVNATTFLLKANSVADQPFSFLEVLLEQKTELSHENTHDFFACLFSLQKTR